MGSYEFCGLEINSRYYNHVQNSIFLLVLLAIGEHLLWIQSYKKLNISSGLIKSSLKTQLQKFLITAYFIYLFFLIN